MVLLNEHTSRGAILLPAPLGGKKKKVIIQHDNYCVLFSLILTSGLCNLFFFILFFFVRIYLSAHSTPIIFQLFDLIPDLWKLDSKLQPLQPSFLAFSLNSNLYSLTQQLLSFIPPPVIHTQWVSVCKLIFNL